MKTSLICLLLLAAVACAAPQAGEMPGKKRVWIASKMREIMAAKRKEVGEKMSEMPQEKREEAENPVADAKSDVEAECRCESCSGPCAHPDTEFPGCFRDVCEYDYDQLYYDSSKRCPCCYDDHAPYYCPVLK